MAKEYTYSVKVEPNEGFDLLRVAFCGSAQNDEHVHSAVEQIDELVESGKLGGGKMVKINGPASLPVAVALAHGVSHIYEYVGVYDPKLDQYVVSVSHGTAYAPGDLID